MTDDPTRSPNRPDIDSCPKCKKKFLASCGECFHCRRDGAVKCRSGSALLDYGDDEFACEACGFLFNAQAKGLISQSEGYDPRKLNQSLFDYE